MEVVAPVETAYGVVFDEDQVEHSYQAAIKALKYTKTDNRFEHNWSNQHNLDPKMLPGGSGQVPYDYDYRQHDDRTWVIPAADAIDWG